VISSSAYTWVENPLETKDSGIPIVTVEGFGEHKCTNGKKAMRPMRKMVRLLLVVKPSIVHNEYNIRENNRDPES